jgi:predicted permease
MLQDIRSALRTFRHSPAFAVTAVLTLSLGIAATVAIFSLFYQVLLRSLAVPHPESLVVFHATGPFLPGGSSSGNHESTFSYPMYQRLASHSPLLEGVAARAGTSVQATRSEGPEREDAELVTGNYFGVLGLRPVLGRLISPVDDQIGRPNQVVVLAYRYWITAYAASPNVLNSKILLNGNPFTVIGVAPEGYDGFVAGEMRAFFLPLSAKPLSDPGWLARAFNEPGTQWLNIIARLKPGVSREQTTVSLLPVWSATLRDHVRQVKAPEGADRKILLAKTLQLLPASGGISDLEARWRKPLTALLAMVLLLLLITCANVANLLIARGVARAREVAIRVAIGAERGQLIRQSLIESLLLACPAGILGTALSFGLLRTLIAVLPGASTRTFLAATPDVNVLSFSLLLVLATVLLFGTFPALQTSSVDPIQCLREQVASGNSAHARWRQALVAGQLALSLMLLVGAAFFADTLVNLLHHDSGLRPDHLIVITLNPDLSGYSIDRGRSFYHELNSRLEQLPGVRSVAMAEYSPLTGSEWSSNVTVEGYAARSMQDAMSDKNAVSPGFFRTLGTAIVRGREFDQHDIGSKRTVAIINEAFAKRFVGTGDPVGKRMTIGAGHPPDMTIIGEVKNSQNLDLREVPKPTFYFPYEQNYGDSKALPQAQFFVRSNRNPKPLEAAIRQTVRSIDPKLPMTIKTMNDLFSAVTYTDRLSAILAGAFGMLATILAAIGLYGVIAYAVTRRMIEMGIRMALGAMPSQVLALVMREVALVTVCGLLIGIPASYALATVMSSQLYGVNERNLPVYGGALVVLVLASCAAGLVPALRAARVDPKTALRYE